VIGHHTHPAVPQAARPAPEPTGIDYLGLVQAAHKDATIGHIAYRDLPLPGLQAPQPIDHHDPGAGGHAVGTGTDR
jgi:hypothetical protein